MFDEQQKRSRRRGFSLVEVSLAVLLIGAGLIILFALFPAGLRECENALHDTHIALFAEKAMCGMRAKAMAIQDGAVWDDLAQFKALVANTVVMDQSGATLSADGLDHTIDDMVEEGIGMTYKLTVGSIASRPEVRTANLRICFGNQWIDVKSQWFYTEFFYSGMP